MYKALATLLHSFLGTDQAYHAQQKKDGTYRKTPGAATLRLLEKTFENEGSIAIYQKNMDLTIKWICLDFDIRKANIDSAFKEAAQFELQRAVTNFCESITDLNIPYLLEYSGNRGFHVWITFNEKISYSTGYEVLRALLDATELSYNHDLIDIDFFPATRTPTDGVGLGVKVPLSKHTKSSAYAHLLASINEIEGLEKYTSLTEELLENNVKILESHKSTSRSDLETILGVFFEINNYEETKCKRIKNIIIDPYFSLSELIKYWSSNECLSGLAKKINEDKSISHEERKIVVGMLINLDTKIASSFGRKLLHQVFSSLDNYNKERTEKAIKRLSSFNFPSQEQIENAVRQKFSKNLSTQELLKACIPNFESYEDATFDICRADVDVVKVAELTYLFLNDEAQSRLVTNELTSEDSYKLLGQVEETIKNPKNVEFYVHSRREANKIRQLVTLKAPGRLATSCVLKQLLYFLKFIPSGSSHGYRSNEGFSGGYIFQPWLYLWIKFVSNISEAIENIENKNFYIVKTDVRSFYDSIPHDNVKRLLLGGINPLVNIRLSDLNESTSATYNLYVNFLFEVTEKIMGSRMGLPQGPAYPRFLAELYLDNLDRLFDEKIQCDELRLYQRYVDDIFFIAPTESAARNTLTELQKELELLGLEINSEKTIVARIENFSDDFDRYRSQSKYAVDSVSRNFSDATDTQKNAAITEFMRLVESDTCNDDLTFIFSHLIGVSDLDELKRSKMSEVITGGRGRGSLYKNLFNFALSSKDHWRELEKVAKFDHLQSEVLTSSLIVALECNQSIIEDLKEFANCVVEKLTPTELVYENLVHLLLIYTIKVDIVQIPAAIIMSCLKSLPVDDDIKISSELIQYLNIPLNGIKNLSDFVEVMYPLCACKNIESKDLNELASVFYAKIIADYKSGNLSTDVDPIINTPSAAAKYYYLLCLFSISNRNKASDLLVNSWKFCAHVFNAIDSEISYKTSDWFQKISLIEYDPDKGYLIISSIVDGNIFRGLRDDRNVFERFHNLILIYLTLQVKKLPHPEISVAIESLKDKALFYKWLIDRDGTSIFPQNKPWFEKNVIENSSVILKKENKILFRKPTSSFHVSSVPVNETNGYSEVVVDYDPSSLHQIYDILSGESLSNIVDRLISVIQFSEVEGSYPNIFSKEKMVDKNTTLPFSPELLNSKFLIVQDKKDRIESFVNNQNNFIKSYFNSMNGISESIFQFKEKYIDNFDDALSMVNFIRNFNLQLKELDGSEDSFYSDVAAAAALYVTIYEMGDVKVIDKFVSQYHKFNKEYIDRHIYAINSRTKVLDVSASDFFNTILYSLGLISLNVAPSVALYFHKDVERYAEQIECLIRDSGLSDSYNISNFKRVYPRVLPLNEVLNVDGVDYKFSQIKLLNVTTGEVNAFEARHSGIISLSEHIYFLATENLAYVIAINSSLSKIYQSIKERFDKFFFEGEEFKSYPTTILDKKAIINLNGFDAAADVIWQHQDITKQSAIEILVRWLSSIPKKFRQPFVLLIAAHVVMTADDVNNFIAKVESILIDKFSNPFLIKKISDYNGTHRILYRRNTIGRSIEDLSPLRISEGAKRATIIVDILLTGSQISNCLKFYLSGDNSKSGSQYFDFSDIDRIAFVEKIKELDSLDICTIFYTNKGKRKIEDQLREILGVAIKVNVIHGAEIDSLAFFGTTGRIGEADRKNIKDILASQDDMKDLYSHLNTGYLDKRDCKYVGDEINKVNLVARYQSLPKKAFNFLRCGLKHDIECHPLSRILEKNEIK